MKRYLVVFKLPAMRVEHGRLKKDLERYGNSEVQIAFSSVNEDKVSLIGFLFMSSAPLSEMTFDGHLFREDSYLLLELGDRQAGEGFGDAMNWLRVRRSY